MWASVSKHLQNLSLFLRALDLGFGPQVRMTQEGRILSSGIKQSLASKVGGGGSIPTGPFLSGGSDHPPVPRSPRDLQSKAKALKIISINPVLETGENRKEERGDGQDHRGRKKPGEKQTETDRRKEERGAQGAGHRRPSRASRRATPGPGPAPHRPIDPLS